MPDNLPALFIPHVSAEWYAGSSGRKAITVRQAALIIGQWRRSKYHESGIFESSKYPEHAIPEPLHRRD